MSGRKVEKVQESRLLPEGIKSVRYFFGYRMWWVCSIIGEIRVRIK